MNIQLPILTLILIITILSCKNNGHKQQNNSIPTANDASLDTIISNKNSQGTDTATFFYKCNVDLVLETHENLNLLTVNDIIEFLKVFSIECSNNVEFSEFSNEVLFEVMDKQPANFIQAMCENHSGVEYQIIYDEIKSPLHDLIPVSKIKSSIESATNRCARIDSIIKSLDVATRNL